MRVMNVSNKARRGLLYLMIGMLAACQTLPPATEVQDTPINNAQTEVPESELLDVGIYVLAPGPINDDDRERGINEDVREAEGRFMAVHLRNTIQQTGHWGAVRVIPAQTEAVEVVVIGEITKSDGEFLTLEIEALDATGVTWFSKSYKKRVSPSAYNGVKEGEIFQDVYNRIANDLYLAKTKLTAGEIERIRRVANLRFASLLAPDAFNEHLSAEDGVYKVQRLPATEDPMFNRVLQIREREHMMVDVINGYYDNLYAEMESPYFDWRRLTVEEAEALKELKRKSTQRYLLGSALILGAIAAEVLGGNTNTSTMRDVMVIGGATAIKSGADLGAQKKMHKEAIREMGESFQAEVTPMIVDVEGQTTEITGSAEEQFIKWRELLRQIYQTETGLPVPTIRSEERTGPDTESEPPPDGQSGTGETISIGPSMPVTKPSVRS